MPDPSPLLAAIRQPAFLYGPDGRIAEANDLAEALAGRPLAGRSLAAVVGIFDARSVNGGTPLLAAEMPAAHALAGEESVDVPIAVTAADGRTLHVLATASPVRDGSAIAGALSIWQDISASETARAGAETAAEELRAQEEELRQQGEELVQASAEVDRQRRLLEAILAAVPYRVSLWDRDERLAWVNERFAADRGASRDALIGRSLRELGDPVDVVEPLVQEALQAVRAGATVTREVEVAGTDGREWRDCTFLPFGPDALLVISGDISERKEADETLRRRLEELETLMETAPVAIWIAQDPACREITGNRRANEFYEAREDENVSAGPPPGEPVPPRRFFGGGRELAAEELPMQYAAAQGVEVRNAELEVLLPSGGRIVMLGSATPLREASGAVRGCLGAFLDITERKEAEEALREREQTLQSIFRAAPVGIGISSDRTIRSVNASLCAMTGYAEEELVGQPTRMLYPSDEEYDLAGWEKYAQIIETGVGAVETRWQRKDGGLIEVLLSASPMDRSSPYENVVTIALDLTLLREKEAALRESEARFRAAFEHSPLGMGLGDPDGRVLASNTALEELLGYGRDELRGMSFAEFTHPDDLDRERELLDRVLAGEAEWYEIEKRYLRRDGRVVLVRLVAALFRDGTGAPQGWIAIHEDITEQKRTEEALRESEANMARAQSTAHLGNWTWDLATDRITCSDEHCRLYGLAPGDYPIETFIDLVHEDDRQYIRDALAAALDQGTAYDVECRVVRPDGVERVLHGEGEVVRDREGRVTGMFGIAQDITDRKQAEEELREYAEDLRRSNEDLERYAYVSSHDLQEPLRSIVSFSQLLEKRYKGQLGQEADEYIDFIVEGGNRMQTLILDLLAYSRVNSKAQELRPTDAEAVVAAVERNLDPQFREAGATLSYNPLPVVTADPLQLEQVFANLVSNAIKFRRQDEPLRVHVSARRTQGFWEFAVKDNGIGIEPEYYDRIFVIFQRLHTKEAYPGTGIGLAIVKRIIDRHGGTIRVESTPGEGSTFFFTLPDGSFKNGGGGGETVAGTPPGRTVTAMGSGRTRDASRPAPGPAGRGR